MKTQNLLLLGIVVVGGFFIIGRRDDEDRFIPAIGGDSPLPKLKYSPVFEAPTFEAPAFQAPVFKAPTFEAPTFQAPTLATTIQPQAPRTLGRRKRERAGPCDIHLPDLPPAPRTACTMFF